MHLDMFMLESGKFDIDESTATCIAWIADTAVYDETSLV